MPNRRYRTIGILLSGLLGVFIGMYTTYQLILDLRGPPVTEANYQEQLQMLEDVQDGLTALRAYVVSQQRAVQETQDSLQALKSEREELEPVVTAQREVVEAVLNAQAAKDREARWLEYLLAFLVGIASSLAATILWVLIKTRHQ